MQASAFSTGRIFLSYSGDPITHYRIYWGGQPGSRVNMNQFVSSTVQIFTDDLFLAPGTYYFVVRGWNGSEEFAETSEFGIVADIGRFRVRK